MATIKLNVCNHKQAFKDLKALEGALWFVTCSECRAKIPYKGKKVDPEKSFTEYVFYCKECETSSRHSVQDYESWDGLWYCMTCGKERKIITEKRHAVFRKRGE